jgi:ribosomal protein S18 acetylase RimI-like enzyme
VVAGNQRRAVEDVCATNKARVWVAEVDGTAVGFVAVEIYDPERSVDQISMLAVDPDYQGSGIGTALTTFALDRLTMPGWR